MHDQGRMATQHSVQRAPRQRAPGRSQPDGWDSPRFFLALAELWQFTVSELYSPPAAANANRWAHQVKKEFVMAKIRDWKSMQDMSARLLQERTGEDVAEWNRRIAQEQFKDEKSLRAWLTKQGVTGYAQGLLVMERFGYPDFLLASADDLIERQYADRPQLRPIFDALLEAAIGLGQVTIQTRKTYVSLVTPRRTFARIQATTKNRVDLALRLAGHKPGGRLQPSKIHETTPLQISLASVDDVDTDVLNWLQEAYDQNI